MTKVSIIIPLYNEAESIPPLCCRLEPVIGRLEEQYETEIVFVDDGSTDDTYRLLKQSFSNWPNVRFLRHERNQNLGGALRTGFRASSGDLICTMDSDCTYDPEKIPELIQLLLDEELDLVTASPYHPDVKRCDAEGYRLFLSRNLSRLYSVILPYKIHCYTSLFRVYRRSAIEAIEIESPGFLAVAEILIKAGLKGFRLGECALGLGRRRHGVSKAKKVKLIRDHLKFMSRALLTRWVPSKLKPLLPAQGSLFLSI